MSYPGATPTKFGRVAVAEPSLLTRMHLYLGESLHTVDHEPPIPVLDQEDLTAQGIDTQTVVTGAQAVDALGSCVANAATVSLGERQQGAGLPISAGINSISLSATDSKASEEFAICLYHLTTDQTGDPGQEWPPTDCGTSGVYVCQQLERMRFIQGYQTASDVNAVVSLLQGGTVIMGSPFFNSWMTPDAQGFVDGQGTAQDLQAAIQSGVAGNHETCLSAVERLLFDELGRINLGQSTVRVRNSWSVSFGDHGSFRLHLSTLQLLGGNVDYKQFILDAAPGPSPGPSPTT